MADALYGGRWFRTLNVIHDNRQALGIEVATSIPSARVIRVLEQLIEMHGDGTGQTVIGEPGMTPHLECCPLLRLRSAKSIRNRGHMPHPELECIAAIHPGLSVTV